MSSRGEGGQSTVEFALCLPFVVLAVVLMVQVGAISAARVRAWHAAREGARVAAVDPDPAAIAQAARDAGPSPLEVRASPSAADRAQGAPVTVTVVHRPGVSLPLAGRIFDDLVLEATATMRIETP